MFSMCARSNAEETVAKVLHSCPLLCTHIGPKALARLTTCSKRLKQDVVSAICSEGLWLLDYAGATARSSTTSGQHKAHQAVSWLAALVLQNAPTNAAAVAQRLLALPSVPLDCAQQVVAAGMRVTYSQLLAAADNMVAGVEVWVQAQSKLGIVSDIPPAAVSICYGFHEDTIWLPAEGHAALLQLAINCSSARTANAAAVCLPTTECLGPELLQPTVARKLLVTAATRQHTAAVVYMAELPLMQQQIDATTLEAVIRQLPEHEQCVQALCALPAAVQLSSDTIAGLLLAVLHATTFSGTYCWGAEVASAAGHLCKLPAAQQLSSKHINSLLRACMQLNIYPYRGTRFVVAVCQLPGAKQLSSGTIVQLLQEAISVKGSDYTQQLCSLPAAAAISGADATSLVSAVCMLEGVDHGMQHNLDSITHRLVRLPAIAQLDNMELGQLLRVLVTNIKPKSFLSYIGLHFLCTLPAAQQLSSEVVEQLLEAALARNNVRCTGVLFTLPGIEQLSSAAVARLLQAAVQAKDSGSINTLVSMTAAAAFSSERAAELLQAAVQCSAGVECIRALTHLPAAAFLDSDQLAAVLKGVAAHCNVACIAQLCSLPAAMQLSGEQITPAVEAAVQRGAAGCISQLMTLPAAKQVRSEAVQALLQTAHQLSDSKRAKCQALLQKMLKAAQQQQQQQH